MTSRTSLGCVDSVLNLLLASGRIEVYICSVVVGGGLNRRTDLTDRQKRQSVAGVGVAVGSAVGVALGVALDNIAAGVAIGVGVGASLGVTLGVALK